jgi:hypothetical protein
MEVLETNFKFEKNLILTFSTKQPFNLLLIECQPINENYTYKLYLSLEDFHKKNQLFRLFDSLKEIYNLFIKLLDEKKVKVEKKNKKIIISIDLSQNNIVYFNLDINNENDNVKIINNNSISDILGKSQSLSFDINLSNSVQDIANIIKNIGKNKSSNSLSRLYFLKKISNYLNDSSIKIIFSEKVLNLIDQIKNNIHFIEEDSIKLESKKTYDIIHFSNYLDKLISDLDISFINFARLLISILEDEKKNEIGQYMKILSYYDKYNTFFEQKIINDLRNCFFDYSLISCNYFEGENLEEYKKRKMNCSNMKSKLLYCEDEDLTDIKNKYFSDSIDYAIFNSKKNKGNIIEKNGISSFIVLEVFYDGNKFKKLENDTEDELNKDQMIEPNGILSLNIKYDKKKEANNIFGNKYLISQKYQVFPLYEFSIKRNEYYVFHFDPEFKKKKNI